MLRKGFTLIELLVVVAIIGILASIILASLTSARTQAKKAAGLLFIAHNVRALYADANLLYDFDEPSGLAIDGSASNDNGTLASGAVRQAGHTGSAMYFDGVDDTVDLATQYRPDQDSFSVAAWFNLDPSASAFADAPIFGNNQGTPFLGYSPSGRYFIQLRQFTAGFENLTWSVSSMPNLADGTWHHVFLTVNQSTTPRTAELFLDGQSVGKKNLSGNEGYDHGNGALRHIGRDYSNSFKGLIDEVGVYKRALGQ